jgi:hypothetical protein
MTASMLKVGAPGAYRYVLVPMIGRPQYQLDTLVTYLSRQPGLPDAHHERHFHCPRGFEYRLVVSYALRTGFVGLFDRSVVRRAVTRALHKTFRI